MSSSNRAETAGADAGRPRWIGAPRPPPPPRKAETAGADAGRPRWIILESRQSLRCASVAEMRGGTRVTHALCDALPGARITPPPEPRWHTRADALNTLLQQHLRGPLPDAQNILSTVPFAIKDAWYYLHSPPSPETNEKLITETVSACRELGLPARGTSAFKHWSRGMLYRWILRTMARTARGFMINAAWGAAEMDRWTGGSSTSKTHVVYPPCELGRAPKKRAGRRTDAITIGAITPAKRHHTVVDICGRSKLCRTVKIVGTTDDDLTTKPYHQKLAELAVSRPGVSLHTDIPEDEKNSRLSDARCAVSACRIEPFGMAIVEAIGRGCIPVVFDNWGFRETVPYPELRFTDADEAAEILDGALAGGFDYLLPALQRHVKRFTTDRFRERVRQCLLAK